MVEALVLVTTVPALVPMLLLDRHPSNLPLVAACALPVGPALSAALYALHHRGRDLAELHPAATFFRGYRLNAVPVLRIWTPWLGGMTIIAVNLGQFSVAGVPGWWAVLLIVLAVASLLWMASALVVTSLFTFRARDVARLAGYLVARTPGATLGNGCLLIVATGVTIYASEAVLALLAWAFAQFLLLTNRSAITVVRTEFTA